MPHVARETLPLIARPDARLVLASLWTAGMPAAQQATADASLGWWRQERLPEGALTHTCLLGDDNRTIFHYSQWADEHGPEEFLGVGMAERFNAIGRAVPGGVAHAPTKYRLYRSTPGSDSATPGCVVIVSVAFDGPDDARLRTWVDLVFDAMNADPPIAGGLAGHFHVSVDGTRVINFAEWTDAESHRHAIDRDPSQAWRAVREFAGIASAEVKRFRPYRTVSRPRATERVP